MNSRPATFVVLLTPPGRGAIATLLVAGPRATEAVAGVFQPQSQKPLAELPLNRILFGRTSLGEEIIVTRRDAQRIEIHCHGGQAAPAALMEVLIERGCQPIDWSQWYARDQADSLAAGSPLAGQIAAAAQVALASASSERTAGILLDQYWGALAQAFLEIEQFLSSGQRAEAKSHIDALFARRDLGLHLTTPWRIVIGGPPNVGKSSLINALFGYDRAITHDAPGTTRDVVTAAAAIDGWPIELADTAGMRDAADAIEAAGVSLARAQLGRADLALLVFDLTQPWSADCEKLLAERSQALIVHNKCDLATAPLADRPAGLCVSALRGDGLDLLQQEISRRLVPQPPEPGAPIPFTLEQIEQLEAWRRLL